MRTLLLIIVLAPMIYGEEPKPHSNTYRAASANGAQQSDGSTSPSLIVINKHTTQEEENNHPKQSPSYLRELLSPSNVPSLALVIVGIAGIIVAVLSLKRVGEQIAEMRRQVDLTFGQLRAMHEQITEMSQQTGILERSVGIAKESADAARDSAIALVNSERAWIMASVAWRGNSRLMRSEGQGKVSTGVHVTITLANKGKTPAWVTEIAIRLLVTNSTPPTPDLRGAEIVYGPTPLHPESDPIVQHSTLIADGWSNDTRWMTLIYGMAKYRDVFTQERGIPERETWFGYRVTASHDLERIVHPEYNKNT